MTARKGSLEKPAKLAAQAAVSLGNSHTGKARARVCAPIRSEAARQAPCRTFREHNAGAACGSRWGAPTEQGNAKMQKANAFLRSPVNNCTPATGGQKWQKKQTESGLPSIAAIRAKEFQCLCKWFNTAVSNNPRRPAGGAAGGMDLLRLARALRSDNGCKLLQGSLSVRKPTLLVVRVSSLLLCNAER